MVSSGHLFVFYIPTRHLPGHASDGLSDLVGI